MTEPKKTPDPMEDLREGLGLLFRAARTAVEKLPTKDLEEAVVSGAKEVERAVKSVAEAVESQFAGRKSEPAPPPSDGPVAVDPAHGATQAVDAGDEPPAGATPKDDSSH
ncbi:MAG: hypothetical protein U0169_02880 [Polyangiaceae bacterium]